LIGDCEYSIDGHAIVSKFVMYYNSEKGLVKVESEQADNKTNKGGYVELVSVQ